jgi:hypothetical protein
VSSNDLLSAEMEANKNKPILLVSRGFRSWWMNLKPHLNSTVVGKHVSRNKTRYIVGISAGTIGSITFYTTHLQVRLLYGC